jgi:anti-sigma factor RsiW
MRLLGELRDRFRHRHDPYPCREAVELVTEYLEGAMTPFERERFERHLSTCGPCTRYVEQVRRTADVLGRVHPEPPTEATQAALLGVFRDFHRS